MTGFPAPHFRAALPSRWMSLMLALGWLCHGPVQARVHVHALFSDHAVIPRDVDLPVWGMADPGENVSVSFAGQHVVTTARDGRWQVRLKPLRASMEPRVMTIRGAANELVISDLLVGDVWLCSGQSNMEWPLVKSSGGREAVAGSRQPAVRLFRVSTRLSAVPVSDPGGSWSRCEPPHSARFSAVAYAFGRDLSQARNIPVGLIGAYVSATPAEYWISRATLDGHPQLAFLHARHQRLVAAYDPLRARADHDAAMSKYRQALERARRSGGKPPREPRLAGNPVHRGPSCAYHGMIHPLQPFPIRGVIWYQGESNRGNPQLYASLFPALIADWRQAWKQPELPFLLVQLPPHNALPPELRQIQTDVWRSTPHTAMVVTMDCGSPTNLHPPVKEPIGKRLALAARAVAYGETLLWSGPVCRGAEVVSGKIVLSFSFGGSGLCLQDGAAGELTGFAVVGADGKPVPARARIASNDTVTLDCAADSQPLLVQYGWAHAPRANLANSANLPAVPFRIRLTDAPH